MNDWTAAGMALAGALIGASAVIGNSIIERRAAARAAARTALERAVEQVLQFSHALDLRTAQLVATVTLVGSLDGQLSRVIGASVPLNVADMFDRLNVVVDALTASAIEVNLAGDLGISKLVDDVVGAAMEVVEAHTFVSTSGLKHQWNLLRGRRAGDSDRVRAARENLHARRQELLDHVRSTRTPHRKLWTRKSSRDATMPSPTHALPAS